MNAISRLKEYFRKSSAVAEVMNRTQAGYENKWRVRPRSQRTKLAAASASSFQVELIEPRLLMSGDISYTYNPLDIDPLQPAQALDGFDLTLRIADVAGTATLQLYNNESGTVQGSTALDGAVTVHLTGGELDDSLKIDLALPAGLNPGAIPSQSPLTAPMKRCRCCLMTPSTSRPLRQTSIRHRCCASI